MKSGKYTAMIAGAGCLAGATGAWANGFYIPVQDAFATSRGNAWVATADSAAAVYYNPAGLTQLDGAALQGGLYAVHVDMDAFTAGGGAETDSSWQPIPQIYGALPLGEKWVAGFGLNTPFGLATHWPNYGPLRLMATDTELTYQTGWLVAAWQATECLSFGGGVGVHHADAMLRQGIGPVPGGPQFEFSGADEGLSWIVSMRWEPAQGHSFGLVYRSQTDFQLDGDATAFPFVGPEPATMDFLTPATMALGYAYRPNDAWEFEINVERVEWDTLNNLLLQKPSGNMVVPFNWESNYIYSAGATRRFDGGWAVNLGYNFIENSQPDLYFNPAVSDADRHWLTAGFGHESEHFSWFFAYQYAFSGRAVTGSPVANGKYNSRVHGLMLSGEWRF